MNADPCLASASAPRVCWYSLCWSPLDGSAVLPHIQARSPAQQPPGGPPNLSPWPFKCACRAHPGPLASWPAYLGALIRAKLFGAAYRDGRQYNWDGRVTKPSGQSRSQWRPCWCSLHILSACSAECTCRETTVVAAGTASPGNQGLEACFQVRRCHGGGAEEGDRGPRHSAGPSTAHLLKSSCNSCRLPSHAWRCWGSLAALHTSFRSSKTSSGICVWHFAGKRQRHGGCYDFASLMDSE